MECWISKMACLACWEWWDIALAGFSFIGGFIADKFFVGRKIDQLRTEQREKDTEQRERTTLEDLSRIKEVLEKWMNLRDPDTGKTDWRQTPVEDVYELSGLFAKHKGDWFSADEPLAKKILAQVRVSLRDIHLHGYKKAKEMRKKELHKVEK